jgi:hypothetical protein
VVAVPGANSGAVEFAAVVPKFMAVTAQFAAFFAHFMAITHDLAVDRMRPGMSLCGVAMGLGESRGQREERGGQQKLAHDVLLQTGSLACDHLQILLPAG